MDTGTRAEGGAGSARPTRIGWSLGLGRLFGIPLRVHVTFLLIVVWYGLSASRAGGSAVLAVAFVLLLFTLVVLHELGHAVVARAFGVRTQEIVLYPIGGIARLRVDRMPTGPPELLIALAGPAVNVVLGLAMLLAALLLDDNPVAVLRPEVPMPAAVRDLLPMLFWGNLALLGFNLIPAFPMDGGRVLRALLTLLMPIERATHIAAFVGQTLAMAFAVFAVVSGQWLLLAVALFVFLGAAQEAAYFRGRAAVVGRRAREAMMTEFETLAPQESLARAADRVLATHQRDFPVVDAWERVVGILTHGALMRGLEAGAEGRAVLDVMERRFASVPPDLELGEVLRLLQANAGVPVLVLDGERLRGMISLENLSEFVEISRRVRPARSG
jgi:stage IV sporulation protein FB